MSTFSANLTKIAIPAAVWLLSLPLADAAFRLAGDRPSPDLQGLFTQFGDSGYKLASGVHTWANFYTGRMDVYTDDLGLRCGPGSATRVAPGDTVDVLFLGDSQGFGNLLQYDDTIVGALSRRAAPVGIRLANASVGGHYLRNQFEIAQWLHDDNRVSVRKLVILLTPVMVSTASSYNRVIVSDDGRLYSGPQSRIGTLLTWAKTHTAVYSRVRGAFRRVADLTPALLAQATEQAVKPSALRVFEAGTRLAEREDALADVLKDFKLLAQRMGATLQIVYVPLVVEVDFKPVQDLARETGTAVDATVPFGLAASAAARLDIQILDLRPALISAARLNGSLSMELDSHYNATTSAAVADHIWNFWAGK